MEMCGGAGQARRGLGQLLKELASFGFPITVHGGESVELFPGGCEITELQLGESAVVARFLLIGGEA